MTAFYWFALAEGICGIGSLVALGLSHHTLANWLLGATLLATVGLFLS